MHRSVCPFVCLWVIRIVRFKCVCFLLGKSSLLNCLHYSPLPRWRTVCWQHTSPPLLSEISCMHLGSSVTTHVYFQQRAKTSRQAAKLAGWDFRFSYAERQFCVFWKSFENFPFFTLFPVKCQRAARRYKNFRKCSSIFIYSQWWWIRTPMRCEGGPVLSLHLQAAYYEREDRGWGCVQGVVSREEEG